MSTLVKESGALKDRAGEYERYSRCCNLRIKGMKEVISENTGDVEVALLKKIAL